MHTPADILALIIGEKQNEINESKSELLKAENARDKYYDWWQEEEQKRKALELKVAELEAELKKADPLRNFVKLSPDA